MTRFKLEDVDLSDSITKQRFEATKRLTVTPIGEKEKLNDKLVDAAIMLAVDESVVGNRIVVFVRKPDDARGIAESIRKHESTKTKPGPYANSVEVLTGTMRGLERDELVNKCVFTERWLNGNIAPAAESNKIPAFLVSTSAGEVGFDLNADHMVCDATTIDSLIQRLGRVNRRGLGDAQIHLFVEPPKKDKGGKSRKLEGLEFAIANTIELLQGITDVSPKNFAALKASHEWKCKDEHGKSAYDRACSPEPTTVELTDILLDAWSMTSIREKMPGRPEVGPWLRGIDDQQAQTTIAWRAEVELLHADARPEKALQAVFNKHPMRPHELVTVNTGRLTEFLKRIPKLNDRPRDLMTTRVAVRLSRGKVAVRTLQELTVDPGILYADSTLILPAKFGGLDHSGILDAESIPKERKEGDPEPPSLDVADHAGYEQTDEARSRLRIIIERSEDGSWTPEALPGLFIPEDIELTSDYDKSTALFEDLKEANLRVRLVQPIEFDDEGDPVKSLTVLAPAPAKKCKEDQLLTEHVGAVEAEAKRIADGLRLPEDDPIRIALAFAARWHDEGKKARAWQYFAKNPDPEHGAPWGKMAQSRDPKSLRGYRHEFGSLLRILHPGPSGTMGCVLPDNLDARELALHLIATHHGAGRPHFAQAVYDPFTDAERDDLHTDSIRRFARLQKKYGWWRLAWLENLLRCADALASADEEVTEIDESEGGKE